MFFSVLVMQTFDREVIKLQKKFLVKGRLKICILSVHYFENKRCNARREIIFFGNNMKKEEFCRNR